MTLKQVARLLQLRPILRRLNFSHSVTVGDVKVKLPVVAGMHSKLNEEWLIALFGHLYTKVSGTFIDVGANKGQTLAVIKAIDPERSYVAIEPNPDCVFYLRRLITMNQFSDVELFCVGAWKKSDILKLQLPGTWGTSPAASFVERFDGRVRAATVSAPVFPLDVVCVTENVSSIGFLKIDAEGAELEVLQGASQIIRAHRPVVVFEGLPTRGSQERLGRQKETCGLLRDRNYSIYRIVRRGLRVPGLVSIEVCGTSAPDRHYDYLAIPREREDAVLLGDCFQA